MLSQLSIQKLIKIHSVWTPVFQLHLARYMHKLYFAWTRKEVGCIACVELSPLGSNIIINGHNNVKAHSSTLGKTFPLQ